MPTSILGLKFFTCSGWSVISWQFQRIKTKKDQNYLWNTQNKNVSRVTWILLRAELNVNASTELPQLASGFLFFVFRWIFVWSSEISLCLFGHRKNYYNRLVIINMCMILWPPVIDICAKNNLTNDSGCRISPGQHEHQRHTEHRREKGNPSAKIA